MTKQCDAAVNNLRVQSNEEASTKKSDFAVCVKPLDLTYDMSAKLVEWIELLQILGVDKVRP